MSRVVLVIIVGLVVSVGAALAEDFDARWSERAITVDGNYGDWNDLTLTYLDDHRASLGFANDSVNLYLLFLIRDPRWAQSIKHNGLRLEIEPGIKGGKKFILTYRGGPDRRELAAITGLLMRGLDAEDSTSTEPVFACEIDGVFDEQPVFLDGSQGPAAAWGHAKGFFLYEFSVPLAAAGTKRLGLGTAAGAELKFKVEWGAPPERRGGGHGFRMGGDGFGQRPGGPGPQGGPPDGERFQRMSKQDLKLTLRLKERPD